LLAAALLVAGTQSLWGQNASETRAPHTYYDPQSRAWVTVPAPVSASAEPPKTTTYTGTLVYNFTITLDANISSSAKIQCTATAIVYDTGTTNEIIESDSVLATRSGSTATCSPTFSYSWNLASESTDTVALGYVITAPSEATGSSVLPARVSQQADFASISVPKTGTTTTETITATF
jgi:hypothetical protein